MVAETSLSFTSYGKYKIEKILELKLPGINIKFQKQGKSDFSYYRKDQENSITEKNIHSDGPLEIQLCPILPLNLPAKKTKDLIFLRLDKQVVIPPNSSTEIKITFPIEIGIFYKFENSLHMIDVVTCEPMHSRFALYGTPENGNLCMYSKISQIDDENFSPYIWAKMKITIKNELDHATSIGKFVFPLTAHQVYFKQDQTESHIDDLEARVYSDIGGEMVELKQIDFSRKQEDWDLSPPLANPPSIFVMEKGFD